MNKEPADTLGQQSLTIEQFMEMDFRAVNEYSLPIELMMENAGLQLALFITQHASRKSRIQIGIGVGNNGGGGLVASRRLAGWGYNVYLDIPVPQLKSTPATQLKRAYAFGAKNTTVDNPDIFVDAYFGFSQRLPLPLVYQQALENAGRDSSTKISLDLPSGFDKETSDFSFHPDYILTLAAPKTELFKSGLKSEIYIIDIGIPIQLYKDLGISQPSFSGSGIVKQSLNHE